MMDPQIAPTPHPTTPAANKNNQLDTHWLFTNHKPSVKMIKVNTKMTIIFC